MLDRPSATHIAHVNRGILRYGWNDPRSHGFTQAIEAVNKLAERSPGFVWRHGNELQPSRTLPFFDGNPNAAMTFSVWESVPALEAFVYKTVHGAFFKRRSEWFLPSDEPNYALWSIPAGIVPDFVEADARLKALIANGPTKDVFDFSYWRQHMAEQETI
ncbi:MAG: DUF3291 domain-containing protein [Pseudomonadota bacterium]